MEPPFVLRVAVPRKMLDLSTMGSDRITYHNLGNSVLMTESDGAFKSVAAFLELLEPPSMSLHEVTWSSVLYARTSICIFYV